MKIRDFEPSAAEGAAELFRALQPGLLTTAAYLLHRESALPARARRIALVAVDDGAVIGWGSANRSWPGGPIDQARVWVGVLPRLRGRGIGEELYARVEGHAVAAGARTLSTVVEDDPAGLRFAEARGFRQLSTEMLATLDPRTADLGGLDEVANRHEASGLKVVPLTELPGRERSLFELWVEAGAFPPVDQENPVTFEEWRRTSFENPLLEPRGSFTILDGSGRPLALSWLLVDDERGLAENEWTATVPRLRGRGLARWAKLSPIRWAAEHGIREILTANDVDNLPMLTLNEHLGYRRRGVRRHLERVV